MVGGSVCYSHCSYVKDNAMLLQRYAITFMLSHNGHMTFVAVSSFKMPSQQSLWWWLLIDRI